MASKICIPVLKVKQPIGEFFTASIDAKVLADIAYADVRRIATVENDGRRDIEKYLGIQRPLNKKRVKEIREYIIHNKDATFPTSVIVAIDERCAAYDRNTNMLYLSPYIPIDIDDEEIPYNRIAKVLDGQHRIDAFYDGDGSNRSFALEPEFQLNVSLFIGIDLPEQAKIFSTVNLTQTKVNKSLVYDLEALAKNRNPYKTCHHIAVALDANQNSPFYQRIKRLGVATPDRLYEPLTQAAFVETLVKFISDNPKLDRNLILDGKKARTLDIKKYPFNPFFNEGEDGDLKIYQIILNYFSAVREIWPRAWNESKRDGSLLSKSNAFKALMKYLKDDVYIIFSEKNIECPTIENFKECFTHLNITDGEFTTKNFVPGSGGQSQFYKLLTQKISKSDLFHE